MPVLAPFTVASPRRPSPSHVVAPILPHRLPVSDRYVANLGLARYVTRVEWSVDAGVTWVPVTYVSGDVTADATSQVRWSTNNLVLAGVPVGAGGLSPFGSRLRVFSGMVHDVDDIEWVPLGVYRVKTVDRAGVLTDGMTPTVSVTGKSLESVVIADRFPIARTFQAQDAQGLLEQLIRESVPGALVQWLLDDSVALPPLVAERDRWALIDGGRDAKSIAKSLAAQVFCDGRGAFVVDSIPSLDDPPAWTVDIGEGGLLVEPAESLSDEGVYNMVVTSGATEATDANGKALFPVGPAIVADTDPASPTRVDGPFGRVVRFYSSPLLRSFAQCVKAGASLLAQNLGLRQQITIQTAVNFALQVGDVVAARMPDMLMASHVVDTITYPLAGGVMSLATRATATRFAGQSTDAPTDTGDVDQSGITNGQ